MVLKFLTLNTAISTPPPAPKDTGNFLLHLLWGPIRTPRCEPSRSVRCPLWLGRPRLFKRVQSRLYWASNSLPNPVQVFFLAWRFLLRVSALISLDCLYPPFYLCILRMHWWFLSSIHAVGNQKSQVNFYYFCHLGFLGSGFYCCLRWKIFRCFCFLNLLILLC